MAVRSIVSFRKRFVILTPWFIRNQLIFDKRKKKFLTFKIRDEIDWGTLSQIYYSEDYNINALSISKKLLDDLSELQSSSQVPLIVDLGANNGISVRYFSEEYPMARIIAFEPDESNFNLARINNSKNEDNINWFNAAIGSVNTSGSLIDTGLGNNAFRIKEDEGGVIRVVGLRDLVQDYIGNGLSPFIIKIDIEGYEQELFSSNLEWIDEFPVIIIELHDWLFPGENNSKNFLNAIANRKRDFVYIGENIFSIKT
jgi:FkbM family methyltransferase